MFVVSVSDLFSLPSSSDAHNQPLDCLFTTFADKEGGRDWSGRSRFTFPFMSGSMKMGWTGGKTEKSCKYAQRSR